MRWMLLTILVVVPSGIYADEKEDQLAQQLAEVVRDPRANLFIRVEAANTIGKLGPRAKAAVPALSTQLTKFKPDEQTLLQESIIKALGKIGNPALSSLPILTKAKGQNIDIDLAVRRSIDQILAASEDVDLVLLLEQLKNKDESVRLRAAKALGKLGAGGKAVIPVLQGVLTDSDADVRRTALASIFAIQPNIKPTADMINVYALDLQDPDEAIRLRAAKSLGKFGPDAQGALPALQRILADPDRDVRRTVVDAINRINPPG